MTRPGSGPARESGLAGSSSASGVVEGSVSGRFEPPADGVLDLLGRMRLGEYLGEEELEEVLRSRRASSGG